MSGLLGGTVLGIIRLSEPFFLHFLKLQILKFFCYLDDDKKLKEAEKNMNKNNTSTVLLLTSLNAEVNLLPKW